MNKLEFVLLLMIISFSALAETRNALFIANVEYTNFERLTNPVPEVNAFADTD